jgi:gliding motility-associated-like protein
MRCFFFCLSLAFPSVVFSALQMQCISVGTAGDVSITWQNTASSALFRSYHIYHSVSAPGPFTLIDSINSYAVQNYLHPSANAGSMNAYYYVELKNTNGTSEVSDTIRAIRLNVTDPSNGYASLTWNVTHAPPISTNSNYYLIYREYPAGIFTLIDSVDISISSLNYLDEISVCGDTVKYRIEVKDASGCISVSNVDGSYFKDRIAPDAPHIDSVSVDVNGDAVIGWSQSSSNDTYGYIIYQAFNDSTAIPIDTVYGSGTTFYQTVLDATAGSQGFRIVAFDTCGNPCGADPLQRTIFLEGTLDRCTGSMNLSWSSYVNSVTTPLYSIVMNENGGGDLIAGTTSSTDFTVNNLKTDSLYCFKIFAGLNGLLATSTSNTICVTPDLPVRPQYSYIRSVSVFPNDVVSIQAYVDPFAEIQEYKLQRSESETGNFVNVQSQAFMALSTINFTDGVSTDKVWYYRIASIDSCGNDAFPSQVSHTIVADTVSSENFANNFKWNSYGQWTGGVSYYLLYRSIDGRSETSPLAALPVNDSSFQDDVRDQFASQGEFFYYLVAYEGPGNPYGFSDSARSNEICFRQKSFVYIPNAFRPEGVNNIFNPAESFVGHEDYSLTIFDRFGEEIFETNDPSVGWDGSAEGHRCEMGVYIYRFTAQDERGVAFERVGRVTLIR